MAILEMICFKILEMSIVASIIGVITLGVQKLFKKKIPPHYLKWIWIVFLIMLVNPIRMESKFSIYNLSQFKIQETRVEKQEKIVEGTTLVEKAVLAGKAALVSNGTITGEKKLEELEKLEGTEWSEEKVFLEIEKIFDMYPIESTISFLPIKEKIEAIRKISIIVYGVGLLIVFIWKCFLNLKMLIMPQTEMEDERLNRILEKAKQKLQIKPKIKLVKQEQIRTPAIYGIFQKKIFLQENILNLTDAEIEIIFLHELAHFKNGDLEMNCFLQCLQVVYWFQPFIYFLLRKIKKDMELANDAFVINTIEEEGKENTKLYLKTLLKLSTSFEMQNRNALAMASDSKELEERIRMIKEKNKFVKNPVILFSIMVVLILGITVCFATNQISEEYEEKQGEVIAEQEKKEETAKLEVGTKTFNVVNPLEGEKVISATYGKRVNPLTGETIAHNGVDFAANKNEKVMAIADGIVETTGYESKFGNQIRIKHDVDGKIYYSMYGCLAEIEVEVGDIVEAGDEIGKAGSTGMSTGPHLHLELTDEAGNTFHPAEWLDI